MAEVGERKKSYQEKTRSGTSLAVQWLRLHTSTAGSAGLMLEELTSHMSQTVAKKWKTEKEKTNKQTTKQQEERGTLNKGVGRMLSVNRAFTKVLLAWGRKPQVSTLLN